MVFLVTVLFVLETLLKRPRKSSCHGAIWNIILNWHPLILIAIPAPFNLRCGVHHHSVIRLHGKGTLCKTAGCKEKLLWEQGVCCSSTSSLKSCQQDNPIHLSDKIRKRILQSAHELIMVTAKCKTLLSSLVMMLIPTFACLHWKEMLKYLRNPNTY